MAPFRRSHPLLSILCLTLFFPIAVLAGDLWDPIDPADLSSKNATVEKDADGEAIFWKVWVSDDLRIRDEPHTTLRNYIRIRIYTDRGKEIFSKVDIPYASGTDVKDIAARTIKPDGTILEVNKEEIFERTLLKSNGVKVKTKSFAFPGLEVGAIVEYRWSEIRRNALTLFDRFDLQRDIPVRLIEYHLKPAHFDLYTSVGMKAKTFHGTTTPFVKEKDGFYLTTATNIPAFHEEPYMPPEYQMRAWMLVYYTIQEDIPAEKLWTNFGKELYERYRPLLKPNEDIRKLAAEITAGATAPDEKLARLFEYCREKIINLESDTSGISKDVKAKLEDNKGAADTLKRGVGTGEDIDVLFASLATAAGFDARITRISDRGMIFFNRQSTDRFLLNAFNVAVMLDGKWRFFDPGSKYTPYGRLRWQEEGESALVPDSKGALWVQTPLSAPQQNLTKRTAKLRLSDDGTLEGEVRVIYNGQTAREKKEQNDDQSPTAREDALKKELSAQFHGAEVTAVRMENVTDTEKPLIVTYHIRVAGYAQRTGKRLFIQPAFFQHGLPPLFPSSERRHPVYFHYSWSEEDELTIDLPAGFALDNADAPAPFNVGSVGGYKSRIGVTEDNTLMSFKRSFFFAADGNIFFPVSAYGNLKAIFDTLNKNDNHTITFKETGSAPRPQQPGS